LLQALGRQEDVGHLRQCGGIGHNADDAQCVRTDLQLVADVPAQRARRRDLVWRRRCPTLRDARHAGSALRRPERGGVSRCRPFPDRRRRGGQWGRGEDAGRTGHLGEVNLGKRCRTQERSGCAGLDHERVDAHGIDGSLGLYPKAVRKSGENERHREHQSGADDRDDEAPPSPLHVAQRREQHAHDVTDAH
jgi:hypothetical protein